LHRIEQLGVAAEIEAVPSVFLGAVELTPVEVAQLYQPLAANGYSVPLRAVVAVETPDGEALTRYPLRLMPQPRREAIAVLNYALTRVVSDGTAKALPGLLGKDTIVAGKTGTTNDRRDSWFVGYTRNRLAVAWVGEDDNRPAGVSGSNAAMRLWADSCLPPCWCVRFNAQGKWRPASRPWAERHVAWPLRPRGAGREGASWPEGRTAR
jgi:penicillin-binding protein 1B